MKNVLIMFLLFSSSVLATTMGVKENISAKLIIYTQQDKTLDSIERIQVYQHSSKAMSVNLDVYDDYFIYTHKKSEKKYCTKISSHNSETVIPLDYCKTLFDEYNELERSKTNVIKKRLN